MRAGGNIDEQVTPVSRSNRVPREVGQDDDGTGEGHTGVSIANHTRYRGRPGLGGRQNLDCCEKRKGHCGAPQVFLDSAADYPGRNNRLHGWTFDLAQPNTFHRRSVDPGGQVQERCPLRKGGETVSAKLRRGGAQHQMEGCAPAWNC